MAERRAVAPHRLGLALGLALVLWILVRLFPATGGHRKPAAPDRNAVTCENANDYVGLVATPNPGRGWGAMTRKASDGGERAGTEFMSAECALAQRPEFGTFHGGCRQTRDIPLPYSRGLLLMRRCPCACHAEGAAR
ncbi:hypothetical protein [Streptomyces blattellae]|uniref:hypothetical protein n=1 Tax=Streptomyces blattellae TaxID=2569855 RepID=UPI0012B98EF9|nr:hypothetical protein [Streptomyces blattellae]